MKNLAQACKAMLRMTTVGLFAFPLLCLSVWVPEAKADGIQLLPPHSTVGGKTTGEWSASWWQYAYSFSMPNDPITDTTGMFANLNQSGPVFYVNQSSSSPVARSFTVPSDKYVLVSIIAAELSQAELGFDKTEAQIRAAAIAQSNLIDGLSATLDGMPVAGIFNYREVSTDFSFVGAPNNPFTSFGGPVGPSGIAVSDGYFLMLAPLPSGTHVIHFFGGASTLGFSTDVTDTITVSPEPSTLGLMGSGLLILWSRVFWKRRATRLM